VVSLDNPSIPDANLFGGTHIRNSTSVGISIQFPLFAYFDPASLQNLSWNYVGLGLTALFGGSSLAIAARQFLREQGDESFTGACPLRRSITPELH